MSEYEPGSLEGIPESGRERLEQNRQGLYTSDLSVNEFLLVTEAGFDPVGLVVGSSIFHIGFQAAAPTSSRELDVLTQAMYSARHLAMTRMEEEADQLGADGIVGDLGGGSLELIDIRGSRIGPGISLPIGGLALSDLSKESPKRAVRIVRVGDGVTGRAVHLGDRRAPGAH